MPTRSAPKPASNPFADTEILVGVTAGIAAYKVADLVSQLRQRNARVSVVMTPDSLHFVGKTTFEALTGRPVLTDVFSPAEHFRGEHIGLADRARLYLIAPATAQALGQISHGLAGDLVSLLALTCTCPLVIAPAMNCDMWAKPAVQRNVAQLQADGHHLIEPGEGWLSCGKVGRGRMAEPTEILTSLEQFLTPASA